MCRWTCICVFLLKVLLNWCNPFSLVGDEQSKKTSVYKHLGENWQPKDSANVVIVLDIFTRLVIIAVEHFISICLSLHWAWEQSVWGETKILYTVYPRVSYFGTVKNILYFLYMCVCMRVCMCACVCYYSCGIYTVHVVQCIDFLDLYPTFLTFTLTEDWGLLQTLYSQDLFKKQILKSKRRTKNTSREVTNAFVSCHDHALQLWLHHSMSALLHCSRLKLEKPGSFWKTISLWYNTSKPKGNWSGIFIFLDISTELTPRHILWLVESNRSDKMDAKKWITNVCETFHTCSVC